MKGIQEYAQPHQNLFIGIHKGYVERVTQNEKKKKIRIL